jgi:hypothetical protein
MSQHAERFVLREPLHLVAEACQQAAAQMGWRVLDQRCDYIRLKEVATALACGSPVQIDVCLTQAAQATSVDIRGGSLGFGPIQSGHVRGQVGAFVNRLQVCLRQLSQQPTPPPREQLAVDLGRLADLHRAGALTDSEFALAKQRLLNQ